MWRQNQEKKMKMKDQEKRGESTLKKNINFISIMETIN